MPIELETLYARLADRMGEEALGSRLRMQVDHAADLYSAQGLSRVHLENSKWMSTVLRLLLRCVGLYEKGRQNTLQYHCTHNKVVLSTLPESLHGYRILHLSDIHGDAVVDGGAALRAAIAKCQFDCCVITGDYRFLTISSYDPAVAFMRELMPHLQCAGGVYGIMGNHDFIEQVPYLEEMGVQVLLNESRQVDSNATLWLAGVDDPHFYAADDIAKATDSCPAGSCVVLLCHSPELYQEAASAGAALMLCGHTHGGQICLPNGQPIMTNANCPRSFCAGAWKHASLQGYTSRGCGASMEPVRFHCPPELVVHELLCHE